MSRRVTMGLGAACAAALLTWASVAPAAERHLVLVSVSPGLDVERLASVLKIYVDGYHITVRTTPFAAAGDLREQLATSRRAGLESAAVASVRLVAGSPTHIEIQLVDQLSDKAILSSLKRPAREEDLYRTLALKLQALLRSTWSEEPSQLSARPELARLVAPLPAPSPPAARRRGPSLDVSYALFMFPLAGHLQQGVAVSAAVPLRTLFEVGGGVQALLPLKTQLDDVTATMHTLPVGVRGGVRGARGRLEGALSLALQVLVAWVDGSSPVARVRSEWTVEPALGLEARAACRLWGRSRLFVSGSALGVPAGKRFTVRSDNALDLTRLATGAQAGLSVDLW